MKIRKSKSISLHKHHCKRQILPLILASNLVIMPIIIIVLFFIQGYKYPVAATLPNEIFSNMTISNNSGTNFETRWIADGSSKQINFELLGDTPEKQSTILNGFRFAILMIPDELKNQVTPDGVGMIQTNLTIPFKDVPLSTPLLESLDELLSFLIDIRSKNLESNLNLNIDVSELIDRIAALNSGLVFEKIDFNATFSLSEDGTYVLSNLDDSLNLVIADNLTTYLAQLHDLVSRLHMSGDTLQSLMFNALLLPVKAKINAAYETLFTLLHQDETMKQYSNISSINSTAIQVPTTIVAPKNLKKDIEAKFVGMVIKAETLDTEMIRTGNCTTSIYYTAISD